MNNAYPGRGLHGEIVRAIGMHIVRGDYAPGQIIDLEDLSEQTDASKTVIREALRVIGAKGMIDSRPKRGTFVRERAAWNLLDTDIIAWRREAHRDTDQLLTDLSELRAILEPESARLAALRRTEADLEALEAALASMRRADQTVEEIVEADREFHLRLFHASHNELLVRLDSVISHAVDVRDQMARQSGLAWAGPAADHEEILQAVRQKDSERVFALMTTLLNSNDPAEWSANAAFFQVAQ